MSDDIVYFDDEGEPTWKGLNAKYNQYIDQAEQTQSQEMAMYYIGLAQATAMRMQAFIMDKSYWQNA